MHPPSAASGYYFSHPDSRYFGVAEIGRDQVSEYAERKDMTLDETEKGSSPTSPTTRRGRARMPARPLVSCSVERTER